MKISTRQKCHAIGYLFLMAITLIEMAVYISIFNVDINTGKCYAIFATTSVFNISIWYLAINYQRIKHHLTGKHPHAK